jgi:hypothetical protein
MAQFYSQFIKNFVAIMALITKLTTTIDFSLNKGMSKDLGIVQVEVYLSIDINITKLVSGVSCSYRCIFVSCGNYVVLEFNKEECSTSSVCF